MTATSGDTDDLAEGTNLCKGRVGLKKKKVLIEHLWVPSTIPSPGVLFAFVCIGGEKGIVWKEEGMEAVLSTLRAVWRTWR